MDKEKEEEVFLNVHIKFQIRGDVHNGTWHIFPRTPREDQKLCSDIRKSDILHIC